MGRAVGCQLSSNLEAQTTLFTDRRRRRRRRRHPNCPLPLHRIPPSLLLSIASTQSPFIIIKNGKSETNIPQNIWG